MRHKKARREAPDQAERSAVQRPQQQPQRRRRQSHQQRRAAQAAAGPSASFLEALAEQRRRQDAAAQPQPEPVAPAADEAAPRPHAELPGYYYDEAKRKYFPITDAYRVEQQKKQKRERLTQQLQTNELELKRSGRMATSWVRYVAERECRFAWSARQRDRRELMPQFVSARMVM